MLDNNNLKSVDENIDNNQTTEVDKKPEFEQVKVDNEVVYKTTKQKFAQIFGLLLVLLIIVAGYIYIDKTRDVNFLDEETIKAIEEIRSLYENGDYDGAIEAARKEVEISGANEAKIALASALLQKGTVDFEEEKYALEAISFLDDVIDSDPDNTDALRLLGYANEIQGKYDVAIEYYNQVISLDQDNSFVFAHRGHVYDLTGEKDKAEADYDQALSIDPNLDFALLNSARIDYFNLDFPSATQKLNRIVQNSGDKRIVAEAHQLIGSIQLDQGNFSASQVSFEKAISLDSNFAIAYANLAESKLMQLIGNEEDFDKKIEDILRDIEKSTEINPNQSLSYLIAGNLFAYIGDFDQAVNIYQYALNEVVDNDITLGSLEKQAMKDTLVFQIDYINNETQK